MIDGSQVVALKGSLWWTKDASDLATRAARAALEIRRRSRDARIGIATGLGSVGGVGVLVGEVIDRAAELSRIARARPSAGTILVDDAIVGLLDRRFHLRRVEERSELVEEAPPGEPARLLLGRSTPCIGRDRELRRLEDLIADCVEESAARVVLVTGPGGAGKSRLRYELLKRLAVSDPKFEVWSAHGDPMHSGSPLRMIAELIRAAFGLTENMSPSEARERLSNWLGVLIPESEARRTTIFLGELAGVSFDAGESEELAAARRDRRLMGDQMLRAVEMWLRAACRQRAVVLVLDDLQWGDEGSTQFLDWVLRRLSGAPLFVLALARPEAHDLFPGLWKDRGLEEIALPPLGKKSCERLVRAVLGNDVANDVVAWAIELSAGNVFYLEELIRAGASGSKTLPESIVASTQLRMARLQGIDQRVLHAASLFGGSFWAGGVGRVLGESTVSESLERLTELELVERQLDARFAGEQEYAFRHILLREAAYVMLTADDKVKGHLAAARWLLEVGEQDVLHLASHFDRGADAARATVFYRRAAEQAVQSSLFERALEWIARARELGPSDDERWRLASVELEALKWLGRIAELEHCTAAALRDAPRRSTVYTQALGNRLISLPSQSSMLGELPPIVARLRTIAGEIIEAARSLEVGSDARAKDAAILDWFDATTRALVYGYYTREVETVEPLYELLERVAADRSPLEPAIEAALWDVRGTRLGVQGDIWGTLPMYRRAAECYARAGDERNELLSEYGKQVLGYGIGDWPGLEREVRMLLTRVEERGIVRLRGKLLLTLATALDGLGRIEEARGELEAGLAVLVGPQYDFWFSVAQIWLAKIHLAAGELDAAEKAARTAHDRSKSDLRWNARGSLARVLLARGRPDEALELVRPDPEQSFGLVYLDQVEHLRARADVLSAVGDSAVARDAVIAAHRLVMKLAVPCKDPEARRAFFAIADCAAILELARAHGIAD